MKRFGLIGKMLGHSFSASYFAEKFEREGLAEECRYDLYELSEIEQVKGFLLTPGLEGFNVTIPYKQQIIPYLDSLDEKAKGVGAVNCVRLEADGRLVGYNTDIVGIEVSLDKLVGEAKIDGALILGTGGAAQAVKYVLRQRGITYKVLSREVGRADMTYDEVDESVMESHHLIINCSPVGMYPRVDEAPNIPYAMLTPSHYLFDLVYNPLQTRFMSLGIERGASVLSGIDMLYAQAEAAWAIWNR